MKIIKSTLFVQQLDEIYENTAENWGLAQADKYAAGVQEVINLTANRQKLWRRYLNYHEKVERPIYYVTHKKHFVFFEVIEEEEVMFVLGVFHSAMDIPERLKELQEREN